MPGIVALGGRFQHLHVRLQGSGGHQGLVVVGQVLVQALEQGRSLFRGMLRLGGVLLHPVDEHLEVVPALQEQGKQFPVQGKALGAHVVQDRLQAVGEAYDVLQSEQPHRSLDGVGGPEHGVDGLVVGTVLLHFQEGQFHLSQELAGFLDQ